MDKATPTPSPASVDSVMAKAMMLVGALGDSCEAATSLPFLEAVTALRAEVERLAAQAAPNLLDAFKSGNAILIDWPMEPVTPQEALKLMDMMDAEYTKTVGKSSPDREMAVCMQRVQHMACDLWASQKEVMRSHFVELVAAQPSQAPVVQAGEYPPLPEELFSEFWGCVAVWDLSAEGEEAGAEAIRIENVVKGLMRAYVDADRASSGATTAQAVYVPRLLTALEICRQYPDFDADTAIGTMLDAAIKGEPNEMLDLVSPHTGAAQAVRMLTKEELTDLIASTVAALTKGQP